MSATMDASNSASMAKLSANVNALLAAFREGEYDGVAKVSLNYYNYVIRMLSHPGSGRVYYHSPGRTHGGKAHTASAPGEPPAPDFGTYRSSWHLLPTVYIAGGAAGGAGTGDERGPWLEYGTSGMAARPHARPALAQTLTTMTETLVAAIVAKEVEAIGALGGGG